ncbi:unnamed protein product [Meganyctiphanes norvegica]|uniref:Uncharacterized protein n=1 Tax=Meganyctiphanes norvegica TaxID=48144 RepID=A0AAV2RJT9_MEGNR
MQASVINLLAVIGLFNGITAQYYNTPVPVNPVRPNPVNPVNPLTPGPAVGPEVVTRTVTVTPTLAETIFNVQTSTTRVTETRTVTQLRNVDVINTDYDRSTVTIQQTTTNRRIQPVPGNDVTTNVRSTSVQVSVSTEVVPLASTVVFTNTVTAFVTRTQSSLVNSVVTHTKCDDIELVTVPSFVNIVVTQTSNVFVTNFITSTIVVTSIATQEPATTNPIPNISY